MQRSLFVLVAVFIALCGITMLRPQAWVMTALMAAYMTALGVTVLWHPHPRLRLLAPFFAVSAVTFAVYAVKLYP